MASNSFSPTARPQTLRIGGKAVTSPQFAWTGYVLAIALYAWVFSQWQVEPVPDAVHALGVLVAALCLFPLALWTARGSRETPAFELICVAYLLAFSSPLYLQPNQIIILSQTMAFTWDETYSTMLLVSVGVFSLIAGYYAVAESRFTFRSVQVDLPMHPRKRPLFIQLAFAGGFALLLARGVGIDLSAGVFNSLVSVIQNLVNVAIVMLGYRVLRGQEKKGWSLALYGAAFLSAVFGLLSGMLENAIIPLLLIVIVRWNVSRRVPVALLAMGLCGFVVLNSVKIAYRTQTWTKNSNAGLIDRLGVWADLLQGTGIGTQNSFEDTFRQSMSRFDLLHNFVHVQQMTPSEIPFYEGQSYSYLLYGWIPRFIWPDKPIAQAGNVTFAVDYKLMTEDQTATTMIGIGHLPEAYANFGVWGVAIIMALQGMFLALVGKMLNGPYSDGGRAIYLALMVFFLNGIGSATASLFMSIPLTVIIAGVILRFFAFGWRAVPIRHAPAS